MWYLEIWEPKTGPDEHIMKGADFVMSFLIPDSNQNHMLAINVLMRIHYGQLSQRETYIVDTSVS